MTYLEYYNRFYDLCYKIGLDDDIILFNMRRKNISLIESYESGWDVDKLFELEFSYL